MQVKTSPSFDFSDVFFLSHIKTQPHIKTLPLCSEQDFCSLTYPCCSVSVTKAVGIITVPSARQGAERGCLLLPLGPSLPPAQLQGLSCRGSARCLGPRGFCPGWETWLPFSPLQAQLVAKLGTYPRYTRTHTDAQDADTASHTDCPAKGCLQQHFHTRLHTHRHSQPSTPAWTPGPLPALQVASQPASLA